MLTATPSMETSQRRVSHRMTSTTESLMEDLEVTSSYRLMSGKRTILLVETLASKVAMESMEATEGREDASYSLAVTWILMIDLNSKHREVNPLLEPGLKSARTAGQEQCTTKTTQL